MYSSRSHKCDTLKRKCWLLTPDRTMLRFQRPLTLVDSLPAGEQLTVVGDGPLRTAVTRAASQDIHVIGSQQRSSVDQYLRSSEGLIFPSRHFESQPLVYLEAL